MKNQTEEYIENKLKSPNFPESNVKILIESYTQPWRKYHTLEHVVQMLAHVDDDDMLLKYAVALHDVVYAQYPVALGVNEYRSANTVSKLCHSLTYFEIKEIEEAIIATAFWQISQPCAVISSLAEDLCDLDLSDLALPYDEMTYWADLALAEAKGLYDKVWVCSNASTEVTNAMLYSGQIKFFTTLLRRDKIYYNHSLFEEKAKENVLRRLTLLQEKIKNLQGTEN